MNSRYFRKLDTVIIPAGLCYQPFVQLTLYNSNFSSTACIKSVKTYVDMCVFPGTFSTLKKRALVSFIWFVSLLFRSVADSGENTTTLCPC